MEKPHILVVDDDLRIRAMLSRYLKEEGFRVSAAEGGAAVRKQLASTPVDLVLLDLMLPDDDGLALAREIRARSNAGIIMVTGRSDIVDTVVGLEVGADDYITKPFHLREVLARVRSVLRRLQPGPVSGEPPPAPAGDGIRIFDGWRLDCGRRELTSPARTNVPLTTGEFDLLKVFVEHSGRVLDRDQLMDLTRGRSWEVFDRSIDAQVARLRKKIEADSRNPLIIKSVRGAGYVFAPRVETA